MKIIDLEKAKDVLDEQRQVSDPHLKDEGYHGTLARSFDVHEALTLWRIGEANKRANPNDIMTALVQIFSSAIAAELEINVYPEFHKEVLLNISCEVHDRAVDALARIKQSPSVAAEEVGTA